MTQPTNEPKTPHWKRIKSVDELTEFYKSVIPTMRTTAREHGYALGLHGSMKRDLDVIAVPWVDSYSSPDILANALMKAASGFTHGSISWEQKPNGRIATALPICCPEWDGCHSIFSLGHMDLSVLPSAALTAQAGDGNRLPLDEFERGRQYGLKEALNCVCAIHKRFAKSRTAWDAIKQARKAINQKRCEVKRAAIAAAKGGAGCP